MRTLLVDGNNLLARADYAAQGSRTKMSVDGVNTSALVIFINTLSKYVRQVQPDKFALYWDRGHRVRDEVDPRYKAKRVKHVEADEGVETPWRQAREFLSLSGLCHYSVEGLEADDLIAMVCHYNSARLSPPPFGSVTILSSDKDLLQLLDGCTDQIRMGGGDERWDVDRVAEEVGVTPANIPLYMALTGDATDGVVGVPGIGPKKAVKALEEVGWDWDALLESLGPERAAQALVGRRLVDLRYPEFAAWSDGTTQVPLLTDFRPTGPDDMLHQPLQDFLARWRLSTIAARMAAGDLWSPEEHGSPPDTSVDAFAGFVL